MIVHNINPVILDLPGALEVRWYGLMYVLAFLVAYFYVRFQIRKGRLAMSEQQLDSFMGLLVVALIVGARIFYAVFYNPHYFLAHPWKLLAIWEGGLSFHGGLLGMVLAAFWFVRKHSLSFWRIVDVFIVPFSLGNAFGRFGNFVNSEIYGRITDAPWGVVFSNVDSAVRHPTQLYAVFYNVVIFLVLLFSHGRLKRSGQTFGLFLVLYSVFRFVNEFFKEMVFYGPLTMGQWLTIPLFFIGLWLLFRKRLKARMSSD